MTLAPPFQEEGGAVLRDGLRGRESGFRLPAAEKPQWQNLFRRSR